MMKTPQTPSLTVVGSDTSADAPPSTLREPGRTLWSSIMSEYAITDGGGRLLLQQIAETVDEIASEAAIIEAEGRMIKGKFGRIPHPLLRHQTSLRAFVARAVRQLGLDVEPVRPIGRPPGYGY
jgi:hypothetical protein